MKKYVVFKQEIWLQPVEIEADNLQDAQARASDGEGEDFDDMFEMYGINNNQEEWFVQSREDYDKKPGFPQL